MKHGTLREYRIKGLALQESSRHPYVILEDSVEGDTLTIRIGPSEATSLLLSLTGSMSPVPQIHDVFAALIEQEHMQPEYLFIHMLGIEESSAVLYYRKFMKHQSLKLKAADGIALAFRLDIPICLSAEAIINATIHNPFHYLAEETSGSFLYIQGN